MSATEVVFCDLCGVALEPAQVTLAYMGSEFKEAFPKCPSCGQVFIPEDIALGKMLQVEKSLEDK